VSSAKVGPAPADSAASISTLLVLLQRAYGEFLWRPHHDAISELILTILSQHTSDTNSGRAFANLIAVFPDWEAIRTAEPSAISDAVRAAGLSTQKGPRIKRVLEQIKQERGSYDLRFLAELPVAEARAWLTALPGVGPKTAACVLLFALGRPALPVDTHVHRVSKRLGLLPAKATADAAHHMLEALVPAKEYYPFHMGLIEHGRRVCKAPVPRCGECILAEICPSAFRAARSS